MSTDKTQYLTPQGLVAFQEELKNLKDNKIPDIASRIDEAKQQGDLSENAEYHQAKEDMAWAQGRAQELQFIIDHAEVFTPLGITENVSVGNIIIVKCNGKEKTYTIVGPQEADPLHGRISNESPLGSSFVGQKVGDKVVVGTPSGKQEYEIIDIK